MVCTVYIYGLPSWWSCGFYGVYCTYGLPSWCTCGFYGVWTSQLVHVWVLWCVHMDLDYPAGARVGSIVCTYGLHSWCTCGYYGVYIWDYLWVTQLVHVCVLWCVHMGLPLSNPAGARVGSRRAQLRKTKLTINLGKIIKVLQDVPHPRLPTGKGGLHSRVLYTYIGLQLYTVPSDWWKM